MPGDLVMTTVQQIKHPTMECGLIENPNYVMFGSVKSFIYMDWDTGMKDDQWDCIVR